MSNPQAISNRYLSYLKLFFEGEAILLDVRTHPESAGHSIMDAINISAEEIDDCMSMIKSWKKPIFTFSTNGVRSAKVAQQLRREGIDAQDCGKMAHVKAALYEFKN